MRGCSTRMQVQFLYQLVHEELLHDLQTAIFTK
jgi:hypothetical protein